MGIAGYQSVPVVYYSLIGHEFQDHKRYFQCVFFLPGFENESRNRMVVLPDASYNDAHLQQGSSIPRTIAAIDRSETNNFVLVITPEVCNALSYMHNLHI